MEAQLRRDRRPMAGCSAVWPLCLHLERWIASVVERLLVAVSSLYLVISTRGGPSRGNSERDDEIAFGPDRCPPSTAAAHKKSAGINTHKRRIHEPVEPVLCKTNSSSPQCTRYTLGKAAWIFRPSGVCIKAASDEAQKGFCRTANRAAAFPPVRSSWALRLCRSPTSPCHSAAQSSLTLCLLLLACLPLG